MKKGRKPPIRGVVIKVASRCNLNCSYCYVYNQGDMTYRAQPHFIADKTVSLLLQRVKAYCSRHRLKTFRFIFHGGEPLLAPMSFYRHFVHEASKQLPVYTRLSFTVQTNGVLLTDDWCRVLGELDIRIGISLDGPAEAHDRYRVDHQGRGSYVAVVAGLRRAQQHTSVRYHPAVLSVIDPATDPRVFFDHVQQLGIKALNLLFPDGTHTHLPPHLHPGSCQTPYADWLICVFDQWVGLPASGRPDIRLFQQIINVILGFDASTNSIGRTENLFLIIETDGSIEAEDSLKVCQPGITKEGMHVQSHTLDQAMTAPLLAQCASSQRSLATACQPCPIREVCGGGFIVHRYHPATGFNNPSVYCRDLLKLITHIQNHLFRVLPASLWAPSGVRILKFEEALAMVEEAKSRYKTELVE